MKRKIWFIGITAAVIIISGVWFVRPIFVNAHCDTMDGPVVITAKSALEKGDVTPVLKWVKKEYEDEIRAIFKKTLAVRGKGPEAKELADMYFFETLVRIHRAGEGAPYTGLKPVGAEIEPAVELADKSIEQGSADGLIKALNKHLEQGVKLRFDKVIESKKNADKSVEEGREFVEAYVDFVHFVERIHMDITSKSFHHGESEENGHEH
ncbi:MAG: hypothetical protein HY811_12450 [Planctomycetes bacterium]|nr:hypothetical protein [Planctomycetota bacterium]